MTILTVTLHPAIDKVVQTPRVEPNEISRVKVTMLYGGGKGNNVARALTRLNVPVITTGFQGGHSGKFITEELEGEGIKTDFVFCQEPTRTSTLLLEDETGNSFAIYEPGQGVTQAEIDSLLEKIKGYLDQVSLILLCGSGQTKLLEGTYAEIIKLAKRADRRCIIDSSGGSLTVGINSLPFMVKVNQHELSEYFDKKLDNLDVQYDAILELQKKGIEIVALSRGAEGMIITDGTSSFEAKLKVDSIVNVVGAGDSLLAGIARSILAESPLAEIVRWGVACGTANTQVRGAGFINQELVTKLLEQVEVRELH
jgi:1-phosphofructokinase family hexose kinase